MATQLYQNYTYLPTQISGCTLWLDAADSSTVTLSSGTTNVASWADKSGLGNNATAVGTIPYTAKINSVSAMNFPGTFSTYFAGSVSNSGPTLTALSVFVMNTSSYATARILSLGKIGFGDFNNVLYTAAIERFYTNFDAFRDRTNRSAVIANFGVPVQVCSQFDGTNHTFYMNGTAGLSVASTGNFGYVNYDVGSSMNEENAVNLNGSIGEVVVYSTSLSTTQRQQLEGYLAWKWGIQRNLPPDHPYKNNSPFMNTLTLPVTPTLSIPSFNTSLFLPTNFSGCILWLDAADRSTLFTNSTGTTSLLVSGQTLSYWKDKSSQANNATNTTNQPTVSFGAQNGLSVVNFSGSNYLNLTPSKLPNGSTPFSFFVLFRSSSSSTQVYMSWGDTQNVLGFGRAPQLYITNYTLANDLYGASGISDTTTFNSVYVINSVTVSTTINGWDNGNLFSSTNANVSQPLNIGTTFAYIGVGQVNNALYIPFYLNGQICEIVGYNRVLTTSERQQVEGYLAWKWGLQTNLPATHPYSKSPFPTVQYAPIPPQPPRITSGIWQPNQFTGLALWLDAADTSTIQTSGTTVIRVTDKSPTPKTLTITNTVSYISKQAIVFTNTNGRFNVSGMPSAPYDILTVATANSVTNIFRTLLRTLNTSNPFLLNINTNDLGMWDGTAFRQFGSLTMIPNEKALVYASMASNNTIQASKNGTVSLTSPTPASNESAIAFIGNNTGTGGQPWGTLQEIVIYSTTLSTTQRQQVEGYLAWKWNLQNSLPGNHPYKLFPPAP